MEYSREEEFRLIEEILGGQNEKYRTLIDRYAPMVFHVVRRFENDQDEVEELAQQIFVKVYERLDSFDKQSKFSSWLYTIAMNHCRDYAKNIRRRNKRFSEMEQHDLERHFDTHEAPDREIERQEWSSILMKGLDSITAENAEALLMKYRDGMTYKAMSKRLDVSVNALKVRVHRGRKELKEFVEAQG